MPTYQYACRECGHELEAIQSFSDEALTTCPRCIGPLRKIFSAVGVIFKGAGFYRTDSRPGAAAKSGAETGGGSGDAKPAKDAAASSRGASKSSTSTSFSTASTAA